MLKKIINISVLTFLFSVKSMTSCCETSVSQEAIWEQEVGQAEMTQYLKELITNKWSHMNPRPQWADKDSCDILSRLLDCIQATIPSQYSNLISIMESGQDLSSVQRQRAELTCMYHTLSALINTLPDSGIISQLYVSTIFCGYQKIQAKLGIFYETMDKHCAICNHCMDSPNEYISAAIRRREECKLALSNSIHHCLSARDGQLTVEQLGSLSRDLKKNISKAITLFCRPDIH